ncbi:sulfotransferase family protein [Streptosporangium amethystogenes]|uniref:sulfotransferase family protein n=1 Tax=Streptosporangium amethystogenes TaxID=2002 RepID=UPI0004CAA0B5|nr:sulfotransferase [Streptosporangium amethystogenes]
MPSSRQPVFLLAPARSYSTVSLALLSGHHDLFGFPEMVSFSGTTVGDLFVAVDGANERYRDFHTVRLSGISRAVAEIEFGDQEPQAIQEAHAWMRRRSSWTMGELFDHLLDGIDPLIGLEKSPETVLSDEALHRCLDTYPNARFIHLTRHPISTQRSMMSHLRALTGITGTALAVRAASSWYLAHRRIVSVTRDLPEHQVIRVRAEDLLGEPVVRLPPILDWLCLPYDAECLARMTRTEKWRFAGMGRDRNLYGGDWKFMKSPELRPVERPGPVAFDDDWGLSAEIRRRIIELAQELGYE